MIQCKPSGATLPFLKWAGGKRWLTSAYSDLFPTKFKNYYEPFLGGGAVFFSLLPKNATLSDTNQELIECYAAIRDDWYQVRGLLTYHHHNHCKEYYLTMRSARPASQVEKAARFLYLNRTCWNALYRVNLRGEFNVPMGTKTNVILKSDDFEGIAKALKDVKLLTQDFECVIDQALDGDFIFADPPYTVKHNFNGFVKYNDKIFQWHDQVRLRDSLIRAKERGCFVFLTNANHSSIIELYAENFELMPLKRESVIAASSSNRGKYEELVIRNYS
ncbi:MAG: adenine methylase [Firmicutes bacterium]|nr:adenine methylase [Bacillota bacterium]